MVTSQMHWTKENAKEKILKLANETFYLIKIVMVNFNYFMPLTRLSVQ